MPIPEFETRKSSTVVTPVEEQESPHVESMIERSPVEKEPYQEDISSQEEEEFEIIRKPDAPPEEISHE